jgi:hypothetical protein
LNYTRAAKRRVAYQNRNLFNQSGGGEDYSRHPALRPPGRRAPHGVEIAPAISSNL